MSPRITVFGTACIAAILCAGFAWMVRLPMPFPGFAVIAAALLAFLGTLALSAWLPSRWVWSETELLTHSFRARHGLSDSAAQSALQAITTAHTRAVALRQASQSMRPDTQERLSNIANRLDAAAREIFYSPDRHRDLRNILVRSELIEDAAKAHAKLRARKHGPTEDLSREKLRAALDALDAAFDQTDLRAAKGLLTQVEVASDVAETVLTPRTAYPKSSS